MRHLPRARLLPIVSVGAAIASSAACASRPGAVARAVQPDAPTYAQAAGLAPACTAVATEASPFMVDWRPEQRADLEAAMRQSVAVVAYDCHTLKVLDGCSIEGGYGFIGVTEKEQVIRLDDADEIRANLPLSGLKLGASLQGELTRGTTLDVALSIIGKRVSAKRAVTRADLKGACDGATHFVRAATLGAFAMKTGTRAKVATAVEIFGAKTDGASSSSADATNRDGDLEACKTASPDAPAPQPRCGAPLRLELTAIAADSAAKPADAAHAAMCPDGFVLVGGKCARPTSAPHRCAYGDAQDCLRQCDAGDTDSCVILGDMHRLGERAPLNPARARELFQRACDKDDPTGCDALGALIANGEGTPKDPAAAAALFRKACDGGNAGACGNLARLHMMGRGVDKDFARGLALLGRACEGGDVRSCELTGTLYAVGQGVPRDLTKAAALLARACDGASWVACANLGTLYFYGQGVGADATRAALLFQQACDHDNQGACVSLGMAYELGRGAVKDPKRAADLYMDACSLKSDVGCASYAMALEIAGKHKPAFVRDKYERACRGDVKGCGLVDDLRRDCDLGEVRACTLAGAILRQTDKKAAAPLLQRGCAGGGGVQDEAACALARGAK
jgi:TPR repeat protein